MTDLIIPSSFFYDRKQKLLPPLHCTCNWVPAIERHVGQLSHFELQRMSHICQLIVLFYTSLTGSGLTVMRASDLWWCQVAYCFSRRSETDHKRRVCYLQASLTVLRLSHHKSSLCTNVSSVLKHPTLRQNYHRRIFQWEGFPAGIRSISVGLWKTCQSTMLSTEWRDCRARKVHKCSCIFYTCRLVLPFSRPAIFTFLDFLFTINWYRKVS